MVAVVAAASTSVATLVVLGAAGASAEESGRTGTPSPHLFHSFATTAAPAADELAAAMDVPKDTLRSADLMGSDPAGTAILGVQDGLKFPTQGDSYVALSTGNAADALSPNSSGGLSSTLGGIDNTQGQDLVRLHLALHSPANAHCLAFDLSFLSEEYPEYVGSSYNDAFTAQIDNPMLGVLGNDVSAPQNFARDTQGNPLSVNTVFGMHGNTGTTYDGTTSTLRASTPVDPDDDLDIYLSVQDLGDSVFDSAVFLDNFFWSEDENCSYGSTEDTDGDGLLDDWETGGLDVKTDGVTHHVDLPGMGADKNVPDIFVETDYMADSDHSHRPDPAAIAEVVDAFRKQGVHLHVDYGKDAPNTYGPTPTWGALSEADALPHSEYLGDNGFMGWFDYSWDDFDDIKADHFDEARAAVFHYNIWAHEQTEKANGSSGLSRGVDDGASDFIVSMGDFSGGTGTVTEQAGTFMHELGHNLGRHHGGDDDLNYKPTYLSIMNYSFQLDGLPYANASSGIDYSHSKQFGLNEGDLDEADGAHLDNQGDTTVGFQCDDSAHDIAYGPVDWNCDGDATDLNIAQDLNKDGDLDYLDGSLDWGRLIYNGGSIGLPGVIREPVHTTFDAHEMTPADYEALHQQTVSFTGGVDVPTTPVPVGRTVTATAAYTGPAGAPVTWSWGDGTTSTGTSVATPSGRVASGDHTYTTAGIYTVTVQVGPSATATSGALVVYDPATGFATGGGTVTMPGGSVPAAPTRSGKAGIAFSMRYQKDAATPTGEVQASWPQAGVSMHAHDVDWLVVNGDQGAASGPTSYNGVDGYRFRLWLTDSTSGDSLRLVVWDPRLGDADNSGAVVLDTSAGTGGQSALSGQVKLH